jgi:hypothetical protein
MKKTSLVKLLAVLMSLAFVWACGGSKSVQNTTVTNAANSVALTVGPGTFANGYSNAPYATITICQPGTTNCTSLDHILIDTGSFGLRILASELPSGFTLPTTASGSASLYECLAFLDSYTWGNVVTGDLELSGEKASSLPIQLITSGSAPTYCSNTLATAGSPQVDTEASLGARGILGIGNLLADCGTYCTSVAQYDMYFACTSAAGSSCSQVGVPVAQQVANPVGLFAADNNGVVIQLASVPEGGVTSSSGTMYFGIGTQSDNTPPAGLTVLQLNNLLNFGTTFQSASLPDSFADTGSNGLFFGYLTNTTTLATNDGITACNLAASGQPAVYFYCPSSELSETAQMAGGANPSVTTTASFNVGNANNLGGGAISDLAGPDTTTTPGYNTSFDWGLPFFFGRTVYVGVEGASSSLGSGVYMAF